MTVLDPWQPDDGADRARALFAKTYGGEPEVVALAPGRVNLMGEHTDYNGGLCLPIALPYATYVAARRREDDRVRLISGSQRSTWEGASAELHRASGWAAYSAGVVWALGEAGHVLGGVDIAIVGSVPSGAGLSSSAALECSTGLAALALLGVEDTPAVRRTLAQAGIRAENEVAGAQTGGMDQTIAVQGIEGQALLLDCRSWETRQVSFDTAAGGYELLVVDTCVHHALNDGGYASRRQDCERAAEQLGVETLRDATAESVAGLPVERIRRRARHVVTEIDRVSATVDAVTSGQWARVGELMLASHASMRDDFEISVPELDAVVETTTAKGALGARMTGGGFGGSAIALVPTDLSASVRDAVDAVFAERGWKAPQHLLGRPSGSARVVV